MSEFEPLLIEIGCEELPPKALDDLSRAFARILADEFEILYYPPGLGRAYASPRRIAAYFAEVFPESPKSSTTFKAVPVRIGWDSAQLPTQALNKKAAQLGISPGAFKPEGDDPNSMLVCDAQIGGEPLAKLLPGIVERALKRLPIPKPMRWGDHDYSFVRPVHWLVMLHGADVIDCELLGLKSGRESRGHRFHHPQPVPVANADTWLNAMRGANVLADPVERRARVRAEVERVAKETAGVPRLSDGLLDEIANLTEWPVGIACAFERVFLAVPQEALVMTMETNQKFVPVFDADGKLTEHFIGVANIESKDPAEIRKGYERVIRPRFADAKFFYDEDLKTPLAAQQEALKSVTYQQSLGSVWDKSVRVAELARVIANRVGADAGLATRAAALSKCDLLTRMVGEFPELQGVMGRYYATANGENAQVAQALDEFYKPRFAGDGVATGTIGKVLAVAERLDTLAGIFAVGQKPSGNKDPFALRRAALGLARTLIESGLALDLKALIVEALQLLPDTALAAGLPKGKDGNQPALAAGARRETLAVELYEFVLDRLRSYYVDTVFVDERIAAVQANPLYVEAYRRALSAKSGTTEEMVFAGEAAKQLERIHAPQIAAEAFEAVRALSPSDLTDFDRRLRAVVEFAKLPQAQALAAANKRIGNILRQAGGDIGTKIDPALLDAGAETDLHRAVEATAKTIAPLAAQGSYVDILRELASLREPVDRYFDAVMVMVDDAAKRANRLALLNRLRRMFLDVADISLLPGT